MKRYLLLGALGAALTLSACDTPGGPEGLDIKSPGFGDSVRANIAAETVNPDAGTSAKPIQANGARIGGALQRYDQDAVKQPELQSTSNVGGSSGGGSGASTGSSGH